MKHYISILLLVLLSGCADGGPVTPPVVITEPDTGVIIEPDIDDLDPNWFYEGPKGLVDEVSGLPFSVLYYLGNDSTVRVTYDHSEEKYDEIPSTSVFGFECLVYSHVNVGSVVWRSDTAVFTDRTEQLIAEIYVDDLKVAASNAVLTSPTNGTIFTMGSVTKYLIKNMESGRELHLLLRNQKGDKYEVLVVDLTRFKIDNPVIGCL